MKKQTKKIIASESLFANANSGKPLVKVVVRKSPKTIVIPSYRSSVMTPHYQIRSAEYISHMAAIVESSDDAIVSKSLLGIIKSWNKGAEKMFGFTSAEAVGKHISIIIPLEYIQEEKAILDKICNNEIVDHYETIRNKKDGEHLFVSLTVSPLKNKVGKIIGVSKIARDITARKKNEEEKINSDQQRIFQNIEKERRANELSIANRELLFQNGEKEKRAAELLIANKELAFQNEEKEKRAGELIVANEEQAFQNREKENRAAELSVANKELGYQNKEKEKRAAELVVANEELAFQNEEKEKRSAELSIANKELVFQNKEKEKRAAELVVANEELAFQNEEKEKRAAELIIANRELAVQNTEKENRAAELLIANKELAFQNEEKENRAAELSVANQELSYQNKEKENRAAELVVANEELAFQNEEKENRAAELLIANKELAFQNEEKEKRAAELSVANKELSYQNKEKEKRAGELVVANEELAFQNKEKENRAAELSVANKELSYQNKEKENRAAELAVANEELAFQNEEKEKRAAELSIANTELVFQNKEKEKRAAELIVANEELAFQNEEKEKRAAELFIANKELIYQNQEKEKRAAELIIANEELAFQNKEKENRAAELLIANKELAFQNEEKEKRAAELIVANGQLIIQNKEKEKRAAELIVANKELAYQNAEKEKRAAELIVANRELAYQNEEKEKRAAELIIANNELIKIEEQFRLVVEAAPNAMIVIDDDGLITLVNNQTEKLFGYNRHELIGNKLEMLIPEKFHHQHPTHRNTFFKEPRTRSMGAGRDLFVLCKNGTEIQVEIGLNPIETAKGQMVLASIVDITERKMQEQALIKHNKELEQFAYVASHDLQEPLRTVSNYMEVFEEDYLPLLDENARRYLHSVKRATERMSILIKSLLAFSRLGHNKVLVNVDCGWLIKEVIADLDTMISKSGASIQVGSMPTLDLYEIEMRQVFQNLLTNAIKFRKKDTRPEIKISAEKIESGWKFSIQDNGIGIVSKSFDRVFDIFQRLDTTEKYEGSGIGLANCKKIVQLHKGEIWIESELGKGTTFYFTISNLTE